MFVSALVLLGTLADGQCSSSAICNRLGTAAYQAGDYALAVNHFDRQIDYAETALEQGADDERSQAARDLALNNAALAQLKAGECWKAKAYLDLARADARATQANRRQLQARCSDELARDATTGIYWQYAGHGLWNRVQIAPTGDETLLLDAFWMRTGLGPMDELGIKAFGELEQIALHVDGESAQGRYDGVEQPETCELRLRFLGQAIEIEVNPDPDCQIGGAGAVLGGRYVLVSTQIPDADL